MYLKYIGFWYTTGTVATYKLIQDIEAEDHILGPLTLRQFIFALVGAFLLYLCFVSFAKHVIFLLVILLPPALFCVFFAFPWGRDQPTELWALAKLRFWFKPRRRVWNQSGIKELVTITAPKKIERVYSNGLSQTEVKSRLQALANTIDSRGWAIKHINAVGYVPAVQGSNPDRLIDIPDVPPEASSDVTPADDIMDANYSPIAQQFQNMIDQSTQNYRQRLVEQLRAPAPAPAQPAGAQAQQWFINHNPVAAAAVPQAVVAPAVIAPPAQAAAPYPANTNESSEDKALSAELRARSGPPQAYSNLRTLQPLGAKTAAVAVNDGQPVQPAPSATPVADNTSTAVTASSDPAILSLSNNNDLNVATIAREAQRVKRGGAQDEVVVSLH